MAKLKKNALGNIIFPMVDKTDFASIESGITASDFNSAVTKKFYGVNHGVSNAYTSGTISRATLLVRSGIFHQELKPAETNYDHVMYRFIHASCADQLMIFETATYDDSDFMSRLSDIGSNVVSMLSDMFSDISDIDSQLIVNFSLISDVESQVNLSASLLATITGQASVLLSNVSDVDSQITINTATLSDFQSNLLSRVPKLVATNSQVSDLVSDLRSYLVGISGALSDVDSQLMVNFSLISDVESALDRHDEGVIYSRGEARGGAAATITLAEAEISTNSLYNDITIGIIAGSAVGQVRHITNYVGATEIATISPSWETQPSAGDSYVLMVNRGEHSHIAVIDDRLSVVQSAISDIDSQMVLDTATLSALVSLVSDVESQVDLLATSAYLSDIYSDLLSAIGGVTATVSASDISDIASAVWAADHSVLGAAASSFGSLIRTTGIPLNASGMSDIRSAIMITTSLVSDVDSQLTLNTATLSALVSQVSDVESQVDLVATSAYLSDIYSDLLSAIGNVSVTLTASDISDIASAVVVGVDISNIESMLSDMWSDMSDIGSQVDLNASLLAGLSDFQSNLLSRVPKEIASKSLLSDINSNLLSYLVGISGAISDVDSQMVLDTATLSDFQSNLLSRVPKLVANNSQLSDLASDLRSYMIGMYNFVSDVESQVDVNASLLDDITGQASVLLSNVSDVESQVDLLGTSAYLSDIYSDLLSAIGGVTATVGASDMSDIASRVWATTEGTRVDSRILVLQSNLSDVESAVDLLATSAYLSDVYSDLYSAIGNVSVTLTASDISDIASAVADAAGDSNVVSMLSDMFSNLSDIESQIDLNASMISDVQSQIDAGVPVGASSMSDIASRVWSTATRTLTQGAASVEAAVSGSTITVYRGTTWVISLTGLGDISTYDTIYFSVKRDIADSDDDAVLRVKDDASGLLRWQKAAVDTATNGVITIDDAVAGDITITILEAETDDAAVRDGYYYDIKGVDNDGQVDLISFGDKAFNVTGDITRVIT